MSIVLLKSIRDMTLRLPSTLIAILALTIGLWGVGTLAVSMFILTKDLPANYESTSPVHVSIRSKGFQALNLSVLRKQSNIEAAEFRDKTSLRIEVKPNVWLPLKLYSIDDFKRLKIAKYFKEEGEYLPPINGILIERDVRKMSQLGSGSIAKIQVKGRIINSNVKGIVFDPGRAPSTQDAVVYAYTSKEYFSKITGLDKNNRLIIRFSKVSSKKEIEAQYQKLATSLSNQGIKVDSFKIGKFNEHPHQFQLNTLLYLNAVIGFLTFALAMVLVSQLMNSLFSQQIRQIGIMKAIGATRIHIFKSYVAYILTLSVSSIFIGLPAAVFSGYAYSEFVAEIINFDILTTELPLTLYLFLAIFGFLLPVIFSLPALLRGTNTSVLEAISDYGITADNEMGGSRKFKFIKSELSALALRNLGRKKKRMFVTMITMALGVAIFLTGFNVRTSLKEFLDESSAAMKSDITIILKKSESTEKAIDPFKQIKGLKSVEGWIAAEVRVKSHNDEYSKGFHLSVSPYNSDLTEHDLLKGSWLTGSREFEFVINQQASIELGNKVGERYTLIFGDKRIQAKLVGIVKEFNPATVYLGLKKYNDLINTEREINKLMISLKNRSYENVIKVKEEIEMNIEQSGLDVVFVLSQAERAIIIFDHLNIILSVLLFFSLLVLIVSAMGMGSAMGINVMERTREIGVLRAIGATPEITTRLFVIEGFFISVISIIVGLLLALPMSWLASIFFGDLILGDETPLNLVFSGTGFIFTLFITLLFGYLASLLPARKASKMTVSEAISYE